jgi:hypothetical protein
MYHAWGEEEGMRVFGGKARRIKTIRRTYTSVRIILK